MKKSLLLLMVLVLSLSLLIACGPTEDPTPTPDPNPSTECTEHVDANKDGYCDNCNAAAVAQDLIDAAAYIRQMYKDDQEVTLDDYTLVGAYGNFTVTWSVDVSEDYVKVVVNEDGTVTIDVTETELLEDVPYVLTATIGNAAGETVVKTFSHKVPKFEVTSFEDYMASKQDDNVIVQGIVVAMNSKSKGNTRNHLFLMDLEVVGGYYSYQMDQDPIADLGIEVGMTVRVSGPVTPYSGMQEIKGGTAKIVDSTIKTFDYIDITSEFAQETPNFAQYVALPVTIKGVTLGDQELGGSSDYLFFTLNGIKSYVRSYKTDLVTTFENYEEAKAAIEADHSAHFGYVADVSGILILYSSNPYLIPTSITPFTNYQLPERTDAEKIDLELGALNIPSAIAENTTITLPLVGGTYAEVVLAWTSNSEYAVIADGNLTITVPDDATTVTLTVTATCGEASDTKSYEIKLSKAPLPIADVLAMEDGTKVVVSGEVVRIKTEWSEQYKNITVYISDGTNEIQLFRLSTKVVVGDIITVTGVVGSYNGEKQIAQGATAVITDPAPVEVSLADAANLADGVRVILKGTVSEINTPWSDQYKNITVTITDGTNTFYIYRLATNVAVGDEVTITGRIGTYQGKKQIAQGATAVIETAEGEESGEGGDSTTDAIVLDFSNVANRTTYAEDVQVWKSGNVTLTNNKAESTSNIGDYTAPARIYKSTSVLIECTGMTKIVFNVNSGKPVSALTDSLTGTGYTVTVDGNTVTVTFTEPTNSLSFIAAAQFRLDSIAVTVA